MVVNKTTITHLDYKYEFKIAERKGLVPKLNTIKNSVKQLKVSFKCSVF